MEEKHKAIAIRSVPVLHKFRHGFMFDTCGCDSDGVKEENTRWYWKDVTCNRCLKKKFRTKPKEKK